MSQLSIFDVSDVAIAPVVPAVNLTTARKQPALSLIHI